MAQNGAVPDLPDAVNKPPEGVVLPPKDIRAIVEKTAGYVARNGPVFEDRIRDKEQANPKFSFLSPQDAYAPFYQWRLNEIRSGRGTAVSAGRVGETPALEAPKGPAPPPEFQFSARMPNISAVDLEIVKLTALHVARKGKSWMTALSQREARNYQFDFLRPQNSLYTFFTRLVDQYTLLLQTGPEGQKAEQARISALQANIQDRFRVMNLAKTRSEYVKWQETQKKEKYEAEEAEKIAYAQIDWHDFVVVETVLFSEADEQADLPPPTTLNDLQSASLEQKAMMSLARPEMRIEEAMPSDDMNGYAYGQSNGYNQYSNGYAQPTQMNQGYALPPSVSPLPPSQPSYSPLPQMGANQTPVAPPPTSSPAPLTQQPNPNASGQPMRIKSDYIPRAQLRQQQKATSICPNCGQSVLNSELDQHLRIELLDPRWKEQQAKASARFSTTNLGGTDVAANLKRLREKTGGGSNDAIAEAAARVLGEQEDEERRKRQRLEGEATGYAGAMPSVDSVQKPPGSQGMSVQEQIRQIHLKHKS